MRRVYSDYGNRIVSREPFIPHRRRYIVRSARSPVLIKKGTGVYLGENEMGQVVPIVAAAIPAISKLFSGPVQCGGGRHAERAAMAARGDFSWYLAAFPMSVILAEAKNPAQEYPFPDPKTEDERKADVAFRAQRPYPDGSRCVEQLASADWLRANLPRIMGQGGVAPVSYEATAPISPELVPGIPTWALVAGGGVLIVGLLAAFLPRR